MERHDTTLRDALADFLGMLALAIKDEISDPDGYDGMAFSRFLADCNAKGIPIVWEDMI